MRVLSNYFDDYCKVNLEMVVLVNFLVNLDVLKKRNKDWKRLKMRVRKAKKYAKDRNRLPQWCDQVKLLEVYKGCPKKLTVDHIIPMCAVKASGLHVPNNLQYMDGKENSMKGNSFTPFREVGGEIVEYYG